LEDDEKKEGGAQKKVVGMCAGTVYFPDARNIKKLNYEERGGGCLREKLPVNIPGNRTKEKWEERRGYRAAGTGI